MVTINTWSSNQHLSWQDSAHGPSLVSCSLWFRTWIGNPQSCLNPHLLCDPQTRLWFAIPGQGQCFQASICRTQQVLKPWLSLYSQHVDDPKGIQKAWPVSPQPKDAFLSTSQFHPCLFPFSTFVNTVYLTLVYSHDSQVMLTLLAEVLNAVEHKT